MQFKYLTTEEAGSEDLIAFERRLIEIVNCTKPKVYMWRTILTLVYMFNGIGAWLWLSDPDSAEIPFFNSLWNHPFFIISVISLIYLLAIGAHKKVTYSDIMVDRAQAILELYNMTCDKKGHLLVAPQLRANKYN